MRNVSYERACENEYVAATNDHIILYAISVPGWFSAITARLSGYPEPGPCWVWTGSKRDGYGQVKSPARHGQRFMLTVHRVVWIATNGLLKASHVLDHDGPSGCHNRACANPAHLAAVTNLHNVMETGASPRALNARKGTCPKGHPLSGANLRPAVLARGGRNCQACHIEQGRERTAILGQAARALGLTKRGYASEYGQSIPTARRVLAELGRQ